VVVVVVVVAVVVANMAVEEGIGLFLHKYKN
jgi:hypothetical protein